MSESMSSPWIRDYLMDVAETYGAQLFNAPVSTKKKKVQLTDLLTYHENSYVWACISDKDYRVSVRISKYAVDQYKSAHGRSVIDSRFFLVFVSSYRPMFSPRPIGPNASGNTHVSHISLEIDHVVSLGTGGHLFGNPRDLESDKNMKEWVLGLRQDGGGGNVFKLRKQKELVQNKKSPPHLPSPPLASPSPAPQHQTDNAAEVVPKPKPERPQGFKRAYAKRWRIIEVDHGKFAAKPAVEEQLIQTELRLPPVEPHLDTTSRLQSREPLACPTSPQHIPSPTSLQRQGTPTDWAPSNRASPVAPEVANTSASGNGIQQQDEPEVLPATSHPPSDTGEHTALDTVITSDTGSLQPPTPAQRTKRSSMRRSSSPPHSPPELCSSLRPSQQLPLSSPPAPSSSLPLPSSSLPSPMSIRKNIQRKVPHPGLPVSRPDPTKQGPVQILVPNSDTSGTGSSQSYSQSQHISQSQQYHHPHLLSHPPAFPSSLAKEFKPLDASTHREEKPVDTPIRTSKMLAEYSPIHGDINEQEATSADDKYMTKKTDANTGKQESELNRPPVPSAPKIEVLEVGKSDTEEETDELQLMHSTARTEVELNTQTGTQDMDEEAADADHKDNQLSVDEAQIHSTFQSSPSRPSSRLAAASVMQHASPKQDTDGVPIHRSTQSSERTGSQRSMHSLFSDPLEDERMVFSHAPILPVGRTEDQVQEMASPADVPRHDPEAWKEPSFIAKNEGKGKTRAVEKLDTPSLKVGKKRQRSAQPESPVPKQAKVIAPEARRAASGRTTTGISGHMQPENTEASTPGKMHSNNRAPIETTPPSPAFQSSKPRLANFVVDFERIDLGKGVPIPRLDVERDIKSMLLRTGRIRTLGDVEKDGSVYFTT
ncbi:hypothetical protein J3R82DRAFT_10645 [Butyriboletus roseoflavus]|nr:hypothetical protein J3R82DRAFT_10645 [Butyriboletus roseoflavus]